MSGAIAGSLVSGFFGKKSADKAADTSLETTRRQLDYQRQAENRARQDLNRIYPQAQTSRNRGYQQAIDFFGNAMPVGMQARQEANMLGQQMNQAAAPQMMNAILGGQVNYDFLQPQQLDYQSQISDLLAGVPTLYEKPSKDEPMKQPNGRPHDQFSHWRGNQNSAGVNPYLGSNSSAGGGRIGRNPRSFKMR